MAEKSSRNGAVLALKPPVAPRFPARWEDSVATVAVRGEVDREALWAIDYSVGRAAAEAGRIVLDLREVSHLDGSAVPELVARRRELLARGGDLVLAVRKHSIAKILMASGGPDLALVRAAEEAA